MTSQYRANVAAVQQDGLALLHIPIEQQTPEICLAAVQQNGLALQYVFVQTPEICLMAIEQNQMAFLYINEQRLQGYAEEMRRGLSVGLRKSLLASKQNYMDYVEKTTHHFEKWCTCR